MKGGLHRRGPAWVLAAALALPVAAHAQTAPASAEAAASYLRAERLPRQPAGPGDVGQGAQALRFVVRDPGAPTRPWRSQPYQVQLPPGLRLADGRQRHEGVTDAQGRTAVYRLAQASEPQDWLALPLIGHGEQISGTRVVSTLGEPLPGWPYALRLAGGQIHCGLSLPSGHSLRWRHAPGLVYVDADLPLAACQQLARVLNPAVSAADPARRLAALRQRLADPADALLHPMLRKTWRELLLQHGSEQALTEALAQALAEPGHSRSSRAAVYNEWGYGLIDRPQPRWPALAQQWLAQAAALEPSPMVLDSLGWAWHHLGEQAQALRTLEQAHEAFLARCTEREEPAFRETQAHRAQVLRRLGREAEALDLLAELVRQDPAAHWAGSLADWPALAEQVEAEARSREERQAPAAAGCVAQRDERVLQAAVERMGVAPPAPRPTTP